MRLQVRFRRTFALLWTRLLLVAMPAACAMGAGAAEAATPDGSRWAAIGPVVGYRTFASLFEMDGEVAIGARVSLGLSDRVTITIDGAHAEPTRRTSGVVASVGDIRTLVSYRLRERGVRPFLLAGLGGQILNFHDAPASASAVLAAGLGAELDLSPDWLVVVEGSADFYRGRLVTYSSMGEELSSTSRETYATGIFSAGLLYRF